MLLNPNFTDADGRPGQDEWWMIIERYWPSSYQYNNHGAWGRETNFHNTGGDDGGIGWNEWRDSSGNLVNNPGNSALALDWLPQYDHPTIDTIDRNSARLIHLPVPTRDTWHTYVVHFIAGRTDGGYPRAGAITVWADGNNTPVADYQNTSNVWRQNDGSGVMRTQRWMTLWEGDYTQNLQVSATQRFTLTRLGRTLAEAIADRPTTRDILGGHYYDGSGVNLGPPTATRLPDRDPNAARIPSSLPR